LKNPHKCSSFGIFFYLVYPQERKTIISNKKLQRRCQRRFPEYQLGYPEYRQKPWAWRAFHATDRISGGRRVEYPSLQSKGRVPCRREAPKPACMWRQSLRVSCFPFMVCTQWRQGTYLEVSIHRGAACESTGWEGRDRIL